MKNLSLMRLTVVLVCVFVSAMTPRSTARSVLARNEKRFYKTIDRTPLAIAMFYQDYRAVRHNSPEQSESMMYAERIFERVATDHQFKEGGLIFIKATILRADMKQLAHSFGVTHVPSCVLFKDSELVRDANGKPALLLGINSQESIVRFIKDHVQRELRRNQKEYIQRQEMRALYGPQVSVGVGIGCGPCWGYYDPYDYYPWCYYGGVPSVGLGLSIGGPCGCR